MYFKKQNLEHTDKWKKPVWKAYILYDSKCTTFRKRENYRDSKMTYGCQGLGDKERVMNKWSTEDF